MAKVKDSTLSEHKFLYFFLVFLFFFQVEHGTKYMVPEGCADPVSFVVVFVMMQMMISPERLHPPERRVPGMYRIVHRSIHQIADKKTRKEHKCEFPECEV